MSTPPTRMDRQNDFGHAHLPKDLCIVHAHNITNAVQHAGEFTVALLAGKPPTLATQNITQDNLFDVRHIWWNRQYLLTRPSDFGARSQLKQHPLVFDAKETFLAWKVLSLFYIQLRKNPKFSVKSTQNNKAVPPQLISTATSTRVVPIVPTSEDTRISALENVLAAFNPLAQDEADLDNPATLDATPVAAIPDTKYNKLVLELGTSLDRPATAQDNDTSDLLELKANLKKS
ncbi:hypothetical protein PENARI_c024G04235 [Penicillium arizonense]|uniref:Uncharacterized protein n=1 Tax=Penicillium arizonense TaxID=1835702 RepID=A0A1F5L7N6_PENAI|nr:hypothetical protein PENARI_c024G04235 [Penicillium arizonense]OGE48990.1 hypothetical protein PENARI_c024G04235 [Penicillium arizonense]